VGAVAEKLGRVDEARQSYAAALNVFETAQAHYNLAVTYWGRDWNQVITHMRRAVEINPQMSEARNYLAKRRCFGEKNDDSSSRRKPDQDFNINEKNWPRLSPGRRPLLLSFASMYICALPAVKNLSPTYDEPFISPPPRFSWATAIPYRRFHIRRG